MDALPTLFEYLQDNMFTMIALNSTYAHFSKSGKDNCDLDVGQCKASIQNFFLILPKKNLID